MPRTSSDDASLRQDIPVGEGYRLLQPDEPLQAGDECLDDDGHTWALVPWAFLRSRFNPRFHVPMRRAIPT